MSHLLLAIVTLAAPIAGETQARTTREFSGLELSLAGQVRAELAPSMDQETWLEEVAVPRIRTKLRTDQWRHSSYALQLNSSPDKLEWVDVYVDVDVGESGSLRLGQHKIALSAYRQQSNFDLTLTDWSPVTRFFGAERQIGATFQERYGPWRAALGLYSGENARASHGVGAAELAGTELENRSAFLDRGTYGTLHPELAGRVEYAGDSVRVSASSAWDSAPTPEDFRLRGTLEAHLTHGRHSLWAVGYAARASGDPAGVFGGLLEASVQVTQTLGVGGRYGWLTQAPIGTSEGSQATDFGARHEFPGGLRYDGSKTVALQGDIGVVLLDSVPITQCRLQLSFVL